jgi:hypothetical protein
MRKHRVRAYRRSKGSESYWVYQITCFDPKETATPFVGSGRAYAQLIELGNTQRQANQKMSNARKKHKRETPKGGRQDPGISVGGFSKDP